MFIEVNSGIQPFASIALDALDITGATFGVIAGTGECLVEQFVKMTIRPMSIAVLVPASKMVIMSLALRENEKIL